MIGILGQNFKTLPNPQRLIVCVFAATALGFFVASLVTGYQQQQFWVKSVTTSADIYKVDSENGTCSSGGKHRTTYKCTKFTAQLRFVTATGESVEAVLPIGSKRGQDIPISQASRKEGSAILIKYDPHNPQQLFADSFVEVFFMPLILFFMSLSEVIVATVLLTMLGKRQINSVEKGHQGEQKVFCHVAGRQTKT